MELKLNMPTGTELGNFVTVTTRVLKWTIITIINTPGIVRWAIQGYIPGKTFLKFLSF